MFESKYLIKMKYLLSLSFLLVYLSSNIFAQHEILFLNGKKLTVSEFQISADFNGDSIISYNYKNRTKEILTDEVFSITDENKTKRILYSKNETLGYDLEMKEMESFVLGSFEARENFHAYGAAALGFAIGVTAVVVPFLNKTIPVNQFDLPLFPVLPILNSTGIAISSNHYPSNSKIAEKYPELSENIYFVEGYRQTAKHKKIRNSIIGGIGGVLTGFVILAL